MPSSTAVRLGLQNTQKPCSAAASTGAGSGSGRAAVAANRAGWQHRHRRHPSLRLWELAGTPRTACTMAAEGDAGGTAGAAAAATGASILKGEPPVCGGTGRWAAVTLAGGVEAPRLGTAARRRRPAGRGMAAAVTAAHAAPAGSSPDRRAAWGAGSSCRNGFCWQSCGSARGEGTRRTRPQRGHSAATARRGSSPAAGGSRVQPASQHSARTAAQPARLTVPVRWCTMSCHRALATPAQLGAGQVRYLTCRGNDTVLGSGSTAGDSQRGAGAVPSGMQHRLLALLPAPGTMALFGGAMAALAQPATGPWFKCLCQVCCCWHRVGAATGCTRAGTGSRQGRARFGSSGQGLAAPGQGHLPLPAPASGTRGGSRGSRGEQPSLLRRRTRPR